MKMLRPEQYEALHWLSQVRHGGLTKEEIAEKCGVSRMTLHRWEQTEEFQSELRVKISDNILSRLPEVAEAMFESAIKNKSSNAAKLLFSAAGMLKSQIEYSNRNKEMAPTIDRESLKARLEQFKASDQNDQATH
jgi:transcriptional regulator with XRE-family HTH domain